MRDPLPKLCPCAIRSIKTLEEVVELYDKGGEPNKWLDFRVVKLNLTPQEKTDLVKS